jgi:hypothetical protein
VIAEVLGRLLLAVRPEAVGAELLLAAGLVAVVLAVGAILRALRVPEPAHAPAGAAGFAELRVLLRASDPAAAGHRRARAPGTTR